MPSGPNRDSGMKRNPSANHLFIVSARIAARCSASRLRRHGGSCVQRGGRLKRCESSARSCASVCSPDQLCAIFYHDRNSRSCAASTGRAQDDGITLSRHAARPLCSCAIRRVETKCGMVVGCVCVRASTRIAVFPLLTYTDLTFALLLALVLPCHHGRTYSDSCF